MVGYARFMWVTDEFAFLKGLRKNTLSAPIWHKWNLGIEVQNFEII